MLRLVLGTPTGNTLFLIKMVVYLTVQEFLVEESGVVSSRYRLEELDLPESLR